MIFLQDTGSFVLCIGDRDGAIAIDHSVKRQDRLSGVRAASGTRRRALPGVSACEADKKGSCAYVSSVHIVSCANAEDREYI